MNDPDQASGHTGRKLILSYEMRDDVTQEYYRFMLGRYVPVLQSMGVRMAEAWHTAYGDYPNRMVVFVSPDEATLEALLKDEVWNALNEQLRRYVTDFSYKVVRYNEQFQL